MGNSFPYGTRQSSSSSTNQTQGDQLPKYSKGTASGFRKVNFLRLPRTKATKEENTMTVNTMRNEHISKNMRVESGKNKLSQKSEEVNSTKTEDLIVNKSQDKPARKSLTEPCITKLSKFLLPLSSSSICRPFSFIKKPEKHASEFNDTPCMIDCCDIGVEGSSFETTETNIKSPSPCRFGPSISFDQHIRSPCSSSRSFPAMMEINNTTTGNINHSHINLKETQSHQHAIWMSQNALQRQEVLYPHPKQYHQKITALQSSSKMIEICPKTPSMITNELSQEHLTNYQKINPNLNRINFADQGIKNQDTLLSNDRIVAMPNSFDDKRKPMHYNGALIESNSFYNMTAELASQKRALATRSNFLLSPSSNVDNHEDKNVLKEKILHNNIQSSIPRTNSEQSTSKGKYGTSLPLKPQGNPRKQKKQQQRFSVKPNRGRKSNSSTGKVREQRSRHQRREKNSKELAAQQTSSPISLTRTMNQKVMKIPNHEYRDSSPPPQVRMINGKKVTIINDKLKVFVIDNIFSSKGCDEIRQMAEDHVSRIEESGSNMSTWRTLYTYTKRDLPCMEVKDMASRFTNPAMRDAIQIVGELYKKPYEAAKLHPRSWKEPHLLKYKKLDNEPDHTGVEMHYDGCHITFIAGLSESSEYEGGGTYIRSLKKTINLKQGQIICFPGELYHLGVEITRGTRYLIVFFMDGFDPKIVDSSTQHDDKEIYQKNVRVY